jgi:hypothetical protein
MPFAPPPLNTKPTFTSLGWANVIKQEQQKRKMLRRFTV